MKNSKLSGIDGGNKARPFTILEPQLTAFIASSQNSTPDSGPRDYGDNIFAAPELKSSKRLMAQNNKVTSNSVMKPNVQDETPLGSYANKDE